jgi:hypothetical protein
MAKNEIADLYENIMALDAAGADILETIQTIADENPEISTIAELNQAIETCLIEIV